MIEPFYLSLKAIGPIPDEWTYWARPCKICNTGHYTFEFAQTRKHAKLYNQDSTWADDKTFA